MKYEVRLFAHFLEFCGGAGRSDSLWAQEVQEDLKLENQNIDYSYS